MCIHMKHHQCLFIYLFIYLFIQRHFGQRFNSVKKASPSLEPKTGVNEQLVMLKGLYRPEQCKLTSICLCPKKNFITYPEKDSFKIHPLCLSLSLSLSVLHIFLTFKPVLFLSLSLSLTHTFP